jgi:hypothetical protein
MANSVHQSARARARRLFFGVAAGVGMLALPALARANDPVMDWNDIARQLTVIPALAAVEQTRAMAIVQVAVHDAVSAVTGQYEQYKRTGPAPAGASPQAAAIAAAHRALIGIVGSSTFLEGSYAASLDRYAIADGDPGLAFGESVADGILELRRNDGAALAAYAYLPADAGEVGVWTPVSAAPTAQALLPGWGRVSPWVLKKGSQFRPGPPPALKSKRYARDYNEILYIGALTNSARTEEQTGIAQFWRASPTALWNPILRQAVETHNLDLPATARVMALFYLAAADASIACWDSKYAYDFWRPQAAIARGDEDGNDATSGDAAWRPLVPTPPHPDYASGHAANSGAMAFTLALLFGDAPGFVIEATSSTNPGFVRRWSTFGEGVKEVIDARVYSGIHFRTADEVGALMGWKIARFVVTRALRPEK